jgi:hypothetical protein
MTETGVQFDTGEIIDPKAGRLTRAGSLGSPED